MYTSHYLKRITVVRHFHDNVSLGRAVPFICHADNLCGRLGFYVTCHICHRHSVLAIASVS